MLAPLVDVGVIFLVNKACISAADSMAPDITGSAPYMALTMWCDWDLVLHMERFWLIFLKTKKSTNKSAATLPVSVCGYYWSTAIIAEMQLSRCTLFELIIDFLRYQFPPFWIAYLQIKLPIACVNMSSMNEFWIGMANSLLGYR